MSYPGNPSLAREAKARITSTYNQSLQLARQGRTQEGSLGCDLILKLDPLFLPARELQTQLQKGAGTDLSLLEPLEFADEQVEVPAAVAASAPAAVALAGEGPTLGGAGSGSLDLGVAPRGGPGRGAESSERIEQLLSEGDALFDLRDYQGAINAWSRIYLIDIDNAEASRRIDRARLLKEEKERQVDELFHQAMALRDAGRGDEARAGFERVLELQPEHLGARESLERLEKASAEPALPSRQETYVADADEEPLPDDTSFAGDNDDLPPLPTAAEPKRKGQKAQRAAPAARKSKAKSGSRSRLFVLGGAVAAVVAGAGFFLLRNQSSLFPNAQSPPPQQAAPPPVVKDPLAGAEEKHAAGQLESAIAELEALDPFDAGQPRARSLLLAWRDELAAKNEAAARRASEDQANLELKAALRERALEAARAAYAGKEYLLAARNFRDADKLAALDGGAADLYEDTKRQLVPLAKEMDLFRQGEYELALPDLWRFNDRDPENRDVRRLLSDCYYNLGVRELQRGSPQDAAEQFQEMKAIGVEPAKTLERLFSFCDAYRSQPKDLLYRIFVSNMKVRR